MIIEHADNAGRLRRCGVMGHVIHIHVAEPHLNPYRGQGPVNWLELPQYRVHCNRGRVGDSSSPFAPLIRCHYSR